MESSDKQLEIGDEYEGVLLETFLDTTTSRPRVRPLWDLESNLKVDFPRNLRDENPIGTRFRADVKICQKTIDKLTHGRKYLFANKKSIKIDNFQPIKKIYPIKLNTASDRSYEYIENEFKIDANVVSFTSLREKAYEEAQYNPNQLNRNNVNYTQRLDIIKTYALSRAGSKCENCEKDAPFLKKNGHPYLEIHHLVELSKNGSDSPINVAAICPNCHRRITHGIDGEIINKILIEKINKIEQEMK